MDYIEHVCQAAAWFAIAAFFEDEQRPPEWRDDWEDRDVETDNHVLFASACEFVVECFGRAVPIPDARLKEAIYHAWHSYRLARAKHLQEADPRP
jgi:hypothetical protein